MSYTFSISFDFSPGTYIQMGEWNFFRSSFFFFYVITGIFQVTFHPPLKLRVCFAL